MMDGMTDKQFDRIIKMVSMILDGCKDLEEAKEKIAELLGDHEKMVIEVYNHIILEKEDAERAVEMALNME